ncbi:hypothetical protein TNCV_3126801 [Trichonephila clavipes]|nr:hypothetical protein TNCV_3126801 [Trichonephila clavipes]
MLQGGDQRIGRMTVRPGEMGSKSKPENTQFGLGRKCLDIDPMKENKVVSRSFLDGGQLARIPDCIVLIYSFF